MESYLFNDISKVLKLGEDKIKALNRLNIYRLIDLILYKPSIYKRTKINPDIKNLKHGDHVYLNVEINQIHYPQKKNLPIKISASNKSGIIQLVFFNFRKINSKIFKAGAKLNLYGKVEFYEYFPQLSHPEVIFDKSLITEDEPIYRLTYGILNNQLRTYIQKSLKFLPNIEWYDPAFISTHNLPSFTQSLEIIHGYINKKYSLEDAYKRLKYDEALANQISFKIIRDSSVKNNGRIFNKNSDMQSYILDKLSFSLTADQNSVLEEIEKDQQSPYQMLRMLQGDVGCGKTIVCVLAACNVLKAGGQVALIAPTEVLSNQHYNIISKLLDGSGIVPCLLTSKIKLKEKNEILNSIENGQYSFVVGTHAIIQEKVKFKDLAFVIVDEQHKFGVNQRKELVSKGSNPDVILMSATPIPRSLSLAMFGDLSMSRIESKPRNRLDIKTLVSSIDKVEDVISFIRKTINKGEKIYWICPLISQENTTESDYADTDMRYKTLFLRFGSIVGQLNGKMSVEEKNNTIENFRNGKTKILVSTTVVEVGVDVPDATLIIIENSEKFGLAQLHQLRGRVGRSHLESTCILLYGKRTSKIAFERLKIMKETNNGFVIADKDLMLRGEGEIFGSKQSGEENFKFLELSTDIKIIEECCTIASRANISQEMKLLANIFNNLNSPEKLVL